MEINKPPQRNVKNNITMSGSGEIRKGLTDFDKPKPKTKARLLDRNQIPQIRFTNYCRLKMDRAARNLPILPPTEELHAQSDRHH